MSTHIVCERLSAMQEQVGPREFFAHFGQNQARSPPIETSHRGLRKLGFEAGRIPTPTGLELLKEDLESLCVCGD